MWETGKRVSSMHTLEAIATGFQISMQDLLTAIGHPLGDAKLDFPVKEPEEIITITVGETTMSITVAKGTPVSVRRTEKR